MAEQTIQPPTPNDINDIMKELKHIKSELKKADLRDREIAWMTFGAVAAALVFASLPNLISVGIAVKNWAIFWGNAGMLFLGLMAALIAYFGAKHKWKGVGWSV